MFSVLLLFLIGKAVVWQSKATIVEKKYKQPDAKCNYTDTYSKILSPVSLVKCAKLCTTSDSCTTFMRGPGKACVLLETCDPKCTQVDDSSRSWKLYYVDDSRCHDDWIRFRDSYYLIIHDNKMTWASAMSFCRLRHSYLAEVESASEDTFLRSHLTYGNDYWLGANDIAQEGVFEWKTSGKALSGGYSNWASIAPNNDGNQDCLQYWSDDTWSHLLWDDDHCSDLNGFICEIPGSD